MRVLVVLLACGACTAFYDIDETMLDPGDRDRDGVIDFDDNCPDVANADQANSDGDALGDACDGCPGIVADSNHDEDGDGTPDPCDVCPGMDNFEVDADADGVGDSCDLVAGVSTRVLFDPFVVIGSGWIGDGEWTATATNTLVAASTLGSEHQGLARVDITLDADAWWVHTQLVAEQRWQPGDRGGVVTRSAAGTTARCEVDCDDASCGVALWIDDVQISRTVIPPDPLMALTLLVTKTTTAAYNFRCLFDERALITSRIPASTAWTPGVVASPRMQLSYVEIVQ